MPTTPRYYVQTYDADRRKWTPQKGVRTGPYSQFGLRKALRKLRQMGFDTDRQSVGIYVERRDGEA